MATPRMGDGNLVRELKRWATEEFNLPPQSLPHDSYLKTLCVGKGSSIWKYVIQHVFQQRKVKIIRGNLQWYKGVQAKELKQAECQSEAVKRRELQEKIEHLRAEISHLDTQISGGCGAEDQLATEEQSISRTWAQVEDNQRRELLLQAFRQHCSVGHQALREDACKIRRQCQNVEQLARKAEVNVLFENEPSSNSGGVQPNFTMATEPQILREVRDLCDERVHFFQSLQESEQKTASSAASHMTREQRAAMFKYWLSAVEDLLCGYPPNQILSALQYLAFRQQRDMEEKLTSLDVTQDVTALRFRYESNHLLDISREEEKELPPVKHLLQCAWEVVEQNIVELNQTRSRVQQLQSELQACKEASMQEVSLKGNDHNDTLALSVLELELQCVKQVAVRDHIGEQCLHFNQEAKSQQQALRNLHNQWQSILDFRQLVDVRQEQIRGLIKGNSSAKTEMTRLHRELVQFVQGKLVPQFGEVITATNHLRNSVSQEARHFGTVSLSSLDRRTVEGVQRIPASWLSIHRLQSSCFYNLCQSLAFPLYRAPEELYSQTRYQLLELCFLRRLLQLHTTTLQKVQQQRELLHEPDMKAILSRVAEEDQKILKSLIPRVRQLSNHVAQGQSYGKQVKTAVSHWWDQPAQHALPEINKGGLTFQQWLQRWKQAAKTS